MTDDTTTTLRKVVYENLTIEWLPEIPHARQSETRQIVDAVVLQTEFARAWRNQLNQIDQLTTELCAGSSV